jgi:hypothetical protein
MTDRNKQYNFFIFFMEYYVDTKYLICPAPVGYPGTGLVKAPVRQKFSPPWKI